MILISVEELKDHLFEKRTFLPAYVNSAIKKCNQYEPATSSPVKNGNIIRPRIGFCDRIVVNCNRRRCSICSEDLEIPLFAAYRYCPFCGSKFIEEVRAEE